MAVVSKKKSAAPLSPFKVQQNAAARVVQVAGTCTCLPQNQVTNCNTNVPQPAIQQFMHGQAMKTYTITWAQCTESPYNSANNNICNTFYSSNVTSTLVLCWYSCYQITAHFTGKPPCLPCMPDDFCIQLNPSNSTSGGSTYYILQGNYDLPGFDNVTLQIVISSDPDVIINCVTNPNDPANQVNYSCNGHF